MTLNTVLVKKNFDLKPEDLSKLVEDRNDGSLQLLQEKYHGVSGLAESLHVDLKVGLTGDDIEERRQVFGSNKLAMKPPKSFFELCWEALQDFTLLVLMGCALLSLIIGIIEAQKPGHEYAWVEGCAIFVTIFVVVMVSAGTDYAKEKQFRALSDIANNINIDVQRKGVTTAVSIFDLVVGDILWVKYGDLIPADGILIDGQELKTDESALTGEPILISKDAKEKPFLLSGTKVIFSYHIYRYMC